MPNMGDASWKGEILEVRRQSGRWETLEWETQEWRDGRRQRWRYRSQTLDVRCRQEQRDPREDAGHGGSWSWETEEETQER